MSGRWPAGPPNPWRLGFGTASVLLAIAQMAWAAEATAGAGRAFVELLDGLGVVVLLVCLAVARASYTTVAIVLLGAGAAYPIANAQHDERAAIAYGVGLWLVAELAYASTERRSALPGAVHTELRYAARVAVATGASVALDIAALAGSAHPVHRAGIVALGVATVVGLVALAALLRTRS